MQFADVILPLSLSRLYTYSVPEGMEVKAGIRVLVPFGNHKQYTAIVKLVHQTVPGFKTREIISVVDPQPIFGEKHFRFWDWMAGYYISNLGEIMLASMPAGLRVESETFLTLAQHVIENFDLSGLTENERQVLNILQEEAKPMKAEDLSKKLGRKNIFPVLNSLITRQMISGEEKIPRFSGTKSFSMVRLSAKAKEDSWMKKIFDSLEKRSPVQLKILMAFLQISMENGTISEERGRLLARSGGTPAALGQLVKKGVMEIFTAVENDVPVIYQSGKETDIFYSPKQQQAIDNIQKGFSKNEVVLFQGITSSGKTEIFIHFIKEFLKQGKQVLYLLPEIALTTQIIRRLKGYLGNRVEVYHSRFSQGERSRVWKQSASGDSAKLILGARSSVLLPFNNLGLVIVDEEHDGSYKQQDPAPRYQARDAALMLARLNGAKTILGSATPSVESFFQAKSGKYALVSLSERFGGIEPPVMAVGDMLDATRKKTMKGPFTPALFERISQALGRKEQIILFQNRRGFAPVLECQSCGWNPTCVNCDVSLVYHSQGAKLRCHYCGFSGPVTKVCPACGDTSLKLLGLGTEKVVEETGILFSDAKISRLDIDSAGSRRALENIIRDFESRKEDILVGTQMVTKGLDFSNVSTIGILNADSLMKYPDFRSSEKCFQLIVQVAGRAGRKGDPGKVVVQTWDGKHPLLQKAMSYDYEGFYESEMEERKVYNYPPFSRLIAVRFKDSDRVKVDRCADAMAKRLSGRLGKWLLGPQPPYISRVKNKYLNQILLKIPREKSIASVKKMLEIVIRELNGQELFRSVIIQADVDPQ